MNDRKAVRLLLNDISDMKLPPISEKVLTACREQKNKHSVTTAQTAVSEKTRRIRLLKYAFAAVLTAAVVSVPVFIVLTNNSRVSPAVEPTSEPNISNAEISNAEISNAVTSDADTTNSELSADSQAEASDPVRTDLERITLGHVFGEVALSGRNAGELETLLLSYNKASLVYEDESYIYNFDKQGRLLEVINTAPLSEDSLPAASEQEIADKADALLKLCFPQWQHESYSTDIEGDADCVPAWTVLYVRESFGGAKEKIMMSFDLAGGMMRILVSGAVENVGNISASEAIDIALAELEAPEYSHLPLIKEELDITVENRSSDKGQYYFVVVNGVPLNGIVYTYYSVEVSAETGEVISVKR